MTRDFGDFFGYFREQFGEFLSKPSGHTDYASQGTGLVLQLKLDKNILRISLQEVQLFRAAFRFYKSVIPSPYCSIRKKKSPKCNDQLYSTIFSSSGLSDAI